MSLTSTIFQRSEPERFETCAVNCLDDLVSVFTVTTPPTWNLTLAVFDQLYRHASAQDARLEPVFREMLVRFLYGEVAIDHFQRALRLLLRMAAGADGRLGAYFAGFLCAPLRTAGQRRAARMYFCALTGLPESIAG